MARFDNGELSRMVAVGAVDAAAARIFFRSDAPGTHAVRVQHDGAEVALAKHVIAPGDDADNTACVTVGGADAPLAPLTRYTYSVERLEDGQVLGGGSFETAPDKAEATPPRFSLAVVSCHQPYNDEGKLSEQRTRLLKVAGDVMAEHDVKRVIACGDQMYSDLPGALSLFSDHYLGSDILGRDTGVDLRRLPRADVRRVYQQRYREMWNIEPLLKLYADYPTYPILDDHEIGDDWGSIDEHKDLVELAAGARAAYHDYQHRRVSDVGDGSVLPDEFHYTFEYGHTAGFVFDLRSERRTGGFGEANTLYGREQYDALSAFLRANRDKKLILIVASVPVIYVPGYLADIGHAFTGPSVDFLDQWSFEKNLSARDALLRLLHAHQEQVPEQKVVLVSGDVHIGCAFAINWRGGNKPITYQLIASPLSNLLSRFNAHLSSIGPAMFTFAGLDIAGGPGADVRLLHGVDGMIENPFGGLNLGIIEVATQADGSVNFRYKLMSYDTEPALQPATKLMTAWL